MIFKLYFLMMYFSLLSVYDFTRSMVFSSFYIIVILFDPNSHVCFVFICQLLADCCDGSDEYDGKVKCPNTCWEAGKVARDKLKKKIATFEEGVKIRKQEVEHAKVAITKDEAELLKLKNEEKILKGLVEQLNGKILYSLAYFHDLVFQYNLFSSLFYRGKTLYVLNLHRIAYWKFGLVIGVRYIIYVISHMDE